MAFFYQLVNCSLLDFSLGHTCWATYIARLLVFRMTNYTYTVCEPAYLHNKPEDCEYTSPNKTTNKHLSICNRNE